MSEIDQVFKEIETYRDEVIQLQKELTSRVALGPSNGGLGEHEKTTYIKRLLLNMNPSSLEEIKTPDELAQDGYRPNLIARWKDDKDEPRVWVLTHSDIVPPGDLSLWHTDPYQVEVQGDRIIGRGVEDNQHGFVSSYLALKAVLKNNRAEMRPVGLSVVADEETGSRYGLQYVLENYSQNFKKRDLIIVPDAGNEEGTMIEVAEKSMLWLKFIIIGKQCHGSTPGNGKNSLFGVAKLIIALKNLEKRFVQKDDLFSVPASTFAPTKIEANVPNINTIPGKDIFYMDCRIMPKYKVDEVIQTTREIAIQIEKELDLDIQVEAVHREDAAPSTSPDSPVVTELMTAIKVVTGKKAGAMGIGGGTVAAFFRKAGLPAAVWSTQQDTAHQPNEYCLISDILTDAKIFAWLFINHVK